MLEALEELEVLEVLEMLDEFSISHSSLLILCTLSLYCSVALLLSSTHVSEAETLFCFHIQEYEENLITFQNLFYQK